jgi:hypothetical protein
MPVWTAIRLFLGANSDSQMATPKLSGKAAVSAINNIHSVEINMGPIPPLRPASTGSAIKKGQEKCATPSISTSPNTHNRDATTSTAHPNISQAKRRSAMLSEPLTLTVEAVRDPRLQPHQQG